MKTNPVALSANGSEKPIDSKSSYFTGVVSWVHFGDPHLTNAREQNYRDFVQLTAEANRYLSGDVNFAHLPGDHAEHGTEKEYLLVKQSVERLRIPLFAAAGDHDVHTGNLDLLQKHLVPEPFYSFKIERYNFILLNAFESGDRKSFDLGEEQIVWLRTELQRSSAKDLSAVLFLHCYPSELDKSGPVVSALIHQYPVLLVEMGHTHYNEIANDGHTLYAATRSTGQIEEGPVGFSITNLDDGVVSWKFNPMGIWPFAMITLPADSRMIINPRDANQVVRGEVELHVKVWSDPGIVSVAYTFDGSERKKLMRRAGDTALWVASWDSSEFEDGRHSICVEAWNASGVKCEDQISVVIDQAGHYVAPQRQSGDDSNTVGAWPEKGILGTQLGPNKNGRKW